MFKNVTESVPVFYQDESVKLKVTNSSSLGDIPIITDFSSDYVNTVEVEKQNYTMPAPSPFEVYMESVVNNNKKQPEPKPLKRKPVFGNVGRLRGNIDDSVVKTDKLKYTKSKVLDKKIWPNLAFISIDRLGFELEGAWINPKDDIHNDLSFHKDDFPIKYNSVGEFVSKPINSYSESIELLRNNWPDVSCNKCGFHIHFSLKSPELYAICMSRDFYDFFLHRIEVWGKINIPDENDIFWARLNGLNKYCKKDFIPDEQASWNEKGHNRLNRRTQLNYCWQNTGTIECRLFPMFDNVELAISVVTELIHIVEDFTKDKTLEHVQKKDSLNIIDNPLIIYQPISLNLSKYRKRKNNGPYDYMEKYN